MPRSTTGKQAGGFSFLEVSIALAIALTVTMVAVPQMTNVMGRMKLRASMTTMSGFLQASRMSAIKKNVTVSTRHFNRTSAPQSLVFYAKEANDNSDLTTKDSQVEMEAPIIAYDTPGGTGTPPAITNTALGLTSNPQTVDPSFNPRGLPCVYTSGTCVNDAFIKYFSDGRVGASAGWSAISVTPAGRIKRWFWNGSSWTD